MQFKTGREFRLKALQDIRAEIQSRQVWDPAQQVEIVSAVLENVLAGTELKVSAADLKPVLIDELHWTTLEFTHLAKMCSRYLPSSNG
jgi:hypothetical protein